MDTAKINYLGGLRNEATHLRSGQVIVTDAPTDNKGRGEAFSPTDLLCTSLATCMMSLMGIAAQEKGMTLTGLQARVVKHMAASPRRVSKVEVHLEMDGGPLSVRERTILENAARTCPVALSLHQDIEQDLHFRYR
jgi:putative redox protein